MNFLEIKKAARRDLHKILAVPSMHIDGTTGRVDACDVRVHTRMQLSGDLDYQGFAELSDGTVLIHITQEDSARMRVKAEDYILYDDKVYRLHTQRDDDGIYLASWYASHHKTLDRATREKLLATSTADWLIAEW